METCSTGTVATCIGCSCTDEAACPGGCYWLRLSREVAFGVCSACPQHLLDWDAGDQRPHAPTS